MPALDVTSVLVIFCALALGGTLKGATGAGAPVVAVPVMAAFFDVRLAVVIMATPNFITNLWQLRQYWPHRLDRRFGIRFGLAGAAGAALGTVLLATLPVRALTLLVASAVILYVGLRLARPSFRLPREAAEKTVLPAGLAGGILQGAAGISAPVAVSFLNAMRLERPQFIATVTTFFCLMAAVQMAALFAAGLLTPGLLGLSAAAVAPILMFMPLGAWAAARMSAVAFDRLTLVILSLLAMRLIYSALS